MSRGWLMLGLWGCAPEGADTAEVWVDEKATTSCDGATIVDSPACVSACQAYVDAEKVVDECEASWFNRWFDLCADERAASYDALKALDGCWVPKGGYPPSWDYDA